MKGREKAKKDARSDSEKPHEQDGSAVDLKLDDRSVLWRDEGSDEMEHPLANEHAGKSTECGKQAGLHEKLRYELPPVSAKGKTHSHLARARHGASEQQIGNVRTRDDQHE